MATQGQQGKPNTPAPQAGKPQAGKPQAGKPQAGKDNKPADAKREHKEYAPVDMDALSFVDVPKEDVVKILPGRERTPEQQKVDEQIKALVYENIDLNCPRDFRSQAKKMVIVPPAQAETIRFMVSKAGSFLNAKIKFGRAAYADGGKEVVSFTAMPRVLSQWVDNERIKAIEEAQAKDKADRAKDDTDDDDTDEK